MKTCSRCKVSKPRKNFNKMSSRKDGLQNYCKTCANIRSIDYGRSKKGLIRQTYRTQLASSKKRGHAPPTYTSEELIKWALAQPLFHKLHKQWVESGYQKHLSPSVDRLDDYKGYSFDNIQLVTCIENTRKSHRDVRNGVNTKPCRGVIGTDVKTGQVVNYPSLIKAGREHGRTTNGDKGIWMAANGRVKTAYGHTWEYVSPR